MRKFESGALQIETTARTRIPKAWFSTYLRTGETPWVGLPDDSELKHNPWHDPQTGRFTFRNQGLHGGGGSFGGGGSSGGGGASGSWDSPPKKPPAAPVAITHGAAPGSGFHRTPVPPAAQVSTQSAAIDSGPAADGRVVARNGYTYRFDSADRTSQVTGGLTLNPTQARSRSAQASAGGSDRLSSDDGGHYIARRFNGPTDDFNHFAQDANFNRGGYRSLEDKWARDVRDGKQVWVKITPSYGGESRRPESINVFFTVNGHPNSRSFPNTSKGGSRGK